MISIIIPIKNEIRYIKKLLQSLENQTVQDFEIIFVEGGSTDGTKEFLRDNIKNHDKYRVLENISGDAASGRNIGIEASRGDYIGFLDGDSFVDPDWMENAYKLLSEINEEKIAGIGGPPVLPPDTKSFTTKAINKIMASPLATGGPLNPSIHHKNIQKKCKVKMASFVIMKKEIFDKEGLFDTKFTKSQDLEYATRLFSKGYYYILDPKIKVWHHDKTNLVSFIRQIFKWGTARVWVMRKHGFNFAYFIPFFTITLFLFVLFLSIFYTPLFIIALYAVILYFIAVTIESLRIAKVYLKLFLYGLLLFPIIHFSYLGGFIKGLLQKK